MDPGDNDPDMALEIAVRNLDIKESSDSEAEEPATGGNVRNDGQLLEEEQEEPRVPTLDRMTRLYSPSPAPTSTAQSVLSSSGITAPPRHQLTLSNIIEDDKTFNLFRRFLKDQCIMRNLNFWLACEHFRKQVRSQSHRFLYDMAKAIYVKFIKGSATQRVTLMDQTRKNIKTSLEQQRFSPFLFDPAQEEIWDVMSKNELRQFLVSGMFADCPNFLGADNVSVLSSVYTPSMANPIINVCGGGSLLHSESEDSASLSSFATESDVGPRSLVMKLPQPIPSGRNAISDCEEAVRTKSHPRRSDRGHTASNTYLTKDKQVSQDKFAALVQERLHAVQKDREGMTMRVREIARQQKKDYNEIMALEWFNLPEAFKYQQYNTEGEGSQPVVFSKERSNQIQAPCSKHLLSPLPTPSTLTDHKHKNLGHINALAYREVLDALKDMDITNQVNESRRPFSRTSGCSSVLSTTSDSGVGDTIATSGLVTPQQERLAAFVHCQKTLTNSIPERERDARAAAISLISNSPQPESLNPHVSSSIRHHPPERHRKYVSNYPEAYSSDDNSSCFTMTSHSSTSDLFIPRRQPPRPAYSDNDDTHHYGSNRYQHRRQLSTPRRTRQPPNPSAVAPPSPIVEHQISNQLTTPTNTRVTPQRDTLVVYHFDDVSTPFAKKISGSCLSLGDFKHKVLKRPGDFRYFFKSFCEDLGMEILEEYCDDSVSLPLIQGKIIGRVERS